MTNNRIQNYSNMMTKELRIIINDAPNTELEWALVMYLFENTNHRNIITFKKIRDFFDIDKNILFEKLNNLSSLWIRQYMNTSEYGKKYYTYEITNIASDFIIKLIELLEFTIEKKIEGYD